MGVAPPEVVPAPEDWNVERLDIDCTETNPIVIDSFRYTEAQHFEFDMHYCLELGVVVEGRMDRYYRAGNRSYAAGEVWLCGVWEPHGWRIRVFPSRAIVFFIHPTLLARTPLHEADRLNWFSPFTTRLEDRPQIPESRRAEVLRIAEEVQHNQFRSEPLQKVFLHLRTLELIGILLDSWNRVSAPRRRADTGYSRVGAAMRLVFESSKFVTASEAARACGLNRNALSRLFLDYTGMSFAQFALRYRVGSAAAQLRNSDEPIKAVATNWGFTDTSHFYRSFVKFYGCAPTDYRRNSRTVSKSLRGSR